MFKYAKLHVQLHALFASYPKVMMNKLHREVEKIPKQGKSRFSARFPKNITFKTLQEISQQSLVQRNVFFLSKSPTERDGIKKNPNNKTTPQLLSLSLYRFTTSLVYNSSFYSTFASRFFSFSLYCLGTTKDISVQKERVSSFSLLVPQKQQEVIASGC